MQYSAKEKNRKQNGNATEILNIRQVLDLSFFGKRTESETEQKFGCFASFLIFQCYMHLFAKERNGNGKSDLSAKCVFCFVGFQIFRVFLFRKLGRKNRIRKNEKSTGRISEQKQKNQLGESAEKQNSARNVRHFSRNNRKSWPRNSENSASLISHFLAFPKEFTRGLVGTPGTGLFLS